MQKKNISIFIKTAIFILVALASWIIHITNPNFWTRIWYLIFSGDLNATVEFLRSFGAWAIVISLLIDILINAAGFLPSIFISTANGIVFGLVPGIIISWIAESVGVIISFFVLRFFFRDKAEALIYRHNYLQKIDQFSGKNGLKLMLFARTLPYFPSGILTAIGAVSSISVKDYIIANFIGKFPSTALEVIIGHDIVYFRQNIFRLSVLLIGMSIIYGILLWRKKKK